MTRLEFFFDCSSPWTYLAFTQVQPIIARTKAEIAAEPLAKLVPLATALFEAYWGDLEDISQDDVLMRVFTRVGLDPDQMMAVIATDSIKDALRANPEELIARGGFGSPTMIVDGDDMYFGNDRLPLVETELAGRA